MLEEFWNNFSHNLFKPLLMFFYFGFLIAILKVRFEFPHVIYQGLTMYLLLAIGWHGGEELAAIEPSSIVSVAGFMALGFVLNFVIGFLAYAMLVRFNKLPRVDKATIAGYYGSDSAGTFATCVVVLTTVGIAFNAYMPVMLAIMEIPGCLIALYLVARLRHQGMDAAGLMPDETGYTPTVNAGIRLGIGPGTALQPARGRSLVTRKWRKHFDQRAPKAVPLKEVLLNPGLCLLVGAIAVGLISGLQGQKVTHDDDTFFVSAFQGALCLFLLEMGMTAARKLKDLKSAGPGFIFFGLAAPNIFATLGIVIAHCYAHVTHAKFELGTYVLFAVLCGAASYIAVPAVQRMAPLVRRDRPHRWLTAAADLEDGGAHRGRTCAKLAG